eukprot:TRINITY_DN3621_c0_g1_i15.p2 TRINITY_DN3621_c0_g1~~TRINITY_DN3621_c0_g1_i15.p2  ORF type:complete len:209 (+),score=86.07 TRINITY_DN3621_c0_g1_i15:1245-1871(+)
MRRLEYTSEYNELERKYKADTSKHLQEIKEQREQKDELGYKVKELTEAKRSSELQIKALENELNASRQDIDSLMKVSADFREKLNILSEKEIEINSKNREYARMIQELNEDKDRFALNEKKSQKEIQKLVEEHREELQMKSDRCDKMLKAMKAGYEERLRRKGEEIRSLRIMNEELEEKIKVLEEQLKEVNGRMDQLYKLEAERKKFF